MGFTVGQQVFATEDIGGLLRDRALRCRLGVVTQSGGMWTGRSTKVLLRTVWMTLVATRSTRNAATRDPVEAYPPTNGEETGGGVVSSGLASLALWRGWGKK